MRSGSVMIRGYAPACPRPAADTGVTRVGESVHLVGVRADPAAAVARVERVDRAHLGIRQAKSNTSRFSSRRSRRTDLGNTMKPFCRCQRSTTWAGDFSCADCRILHRRDAEQVVLALAQRTPRLDPDALCAAQSVTSALLVGGVQLDLVDRGHDAGGGDDALEVRHEEVRDADAAREAGSRSSMSFCHACT
jgi:hypothetical protein